MLVQGVHEPIISEELFYEVQEVLDGKKKVQEVLDRKKKVRIPAVKNKLEAIPLRGFLLCLRCDRTRTGSGSNGKGGIYYYYHCSNGRKERIKAPILNDAFYELLRKVSINEKGLRTFETAMIDHCGASNKDKEREATNIETELSKLRKRLSNIDDGWRT